MVYQCMIHVETMLIFGIIMDLNIKNGNDILVLHFM